MNQLYSDENWSYTTLPKTKITIYLQNSKSLWRYTQL